MIIWVGRGGGGGEEALGSVTRGLNSSSTWLVEASRNTTRRDTRKLPQGWRYFHERQCCQHSRQRIKKRRCGQQAGSFVTRCSVSRGAQRKAHVERYVDETLVDLQWASRPLVATSRRAAKEAPTRRGPFVRSRERYHGALPPAACVQRLRSGPRRRDTHRGRGRRTDRRRLAWVTTRQGPVNDSPAADAAFLNPGTRWRNAL